MSRITNVNISEKLLPKLVAMSSYEVYLDQVKSALEPIRYGLKDMEYLPPQLGGLTGQRELILKSMILQTVEFEVN